jgi:alkaline phosphatase
LLGGKTWRKHGALDYKECVGDDLAPKWATIKFPQTVKAKPGELVIFSYIVFKSRAHRDRVNAKVMKEMQEKNRDFANMPMPFDMKRVAYGGFKTLVEM